MSAITVNSDYQICSDDPTIGVYSESMSRKAVGAYLRALREPDEVFGKDFAERFRLRTRSRFQLAAAIGTNEAQVRRIEEGSIDTRASLMFGYIRAVEADPQEVSRLYADRLVIAEDGTQRARELLERRAGVIQALVDPVADFEARVTADLDAGDREMIYQLMRPVHWALAQIQKRKQGDA